MSVQAPSSHAQARENCAREPIHLTQLVQSYGLMLACHRITGEISHVSANAPDLLGKPISALMGSLIASHVSEAPALVADTIRSLETDAPKPLNLHFANLSSENCEVLGHRSGDFAVIEITPAPAPIFQLTDIHEVETVVAGLARLNKDRELPDFLQHCVTELRRISGYDRVILYRFLPDWSGEVLAESVGEGKAQRFVGLRFPASDIPEQARALYCLNQLRVIADVDAEPVPLLGPAAGAILDQSYSLLRSPSPMHLGYLRNMGVRASMVLSLMKDGQLWGMVACHHHEPRCPPVQLRRMTKMLSALVAQAAIVRIDMLEQRQANRRAAQLRAALNQMAVLLNGPGDLAQTLAVAIEGVMPVLRVQAFGVVIDGQALHSTGVSAALMEFSRRKAIGLKPGEVHATDHLALDVDSAGPEEREWAGALVLPIAGTTDGHLLLLREPLARRVRCAGAPSTREETLPGGLRVMGPRESFAEWRETVGGYSESWSEEDRAAASEIAKYIADCSVWHRARRMEAELRILGSCAARLNDMIVVTEAEPFDAPGPRIVYVNEAFVTETGYSSAEVMGQSPRILQGEQTDRATLDAIRNALQQWKPITVELINYRKDGTMYWAEIAITPVADSKGWFTHWVAIQRNITERKRVEMEIQQLVNFDVLTGLPNRRMLTERLARALSRAERYGSNGALLFVDLDNFKDLNDTAGHQIGDRLLQQVALRLSLQLRSEDMVARLGGDEFVVMLESPTSSLEATGAEAQRVAHKLIDSLRGTYDLGGHSYTTTASIGITVFEGANARQTADELLKQADFAMYQAKGAGRNGWRFYDPAMQAALVARNSLEVRLKTAFQQGQLEVHYQAIVDRHRAVVGVEALLRWRDSHSGWISPVEFISLAEANGMIVPLGLWVLECACRFLRDLENLPETSLRSLTVNVNVSARQIRQPDFVESVLGVVRASGCQPHRLKLELTESMLQHDVDSTIGKMERLRAAGIQFAIDDFGTGYSSLAYLRRLPLNVLKIDRSFVMNIEQSAGDRAICNTVLALGKSLGLQVVAEGVETPQQFDYLLQNGCDQFQGYLFSRPQAADRLLDACRKGQVGM